MTGDGPLVQRPAEWRPLLGERRSSPQGRLGEPQVGQGFLHLCGPTTDLGLDALLLEAARLNRLAIAIEGGHFSTSRRRLAHRQLPKLPFHKTRAQASWWKGRPGY